jgi:hypothetical protein
MTTSPPASESPVSTPRRDASAEAARHLAFGWWWLLVFLALGLVLEALHGFKIGFYLDVGNETRRLMWRLAHAHGTLLGLLHVAFALTLPHLAKLSERRRVLASRCLYGGAIALPLGFFLGGAFAYGGDPGLPIVLAPIGAGLLVLGVLLIALATRRS